MTTSTVTARRKEDPRHYVWTRRLDLVLLIAQPKYVPRTIHYHLRDQHANMMVTVMTVAMTMMTTIMRKNISYIILLPVLEITIYFNSVWHFQGRLGKI